MKHFLFVPACIFELPWIVVLILNWIKQILWFVFYVQTKYIREVCVKLTVNIYTENYKFLYEIVNLIVDFCESVQLKNNFDNKQIHLYTSLKSIGLVNYHDFLVEVR